MFKNWLIALKDQISLHFLDTWSNFLSISWQNVFPGISPAKRIKFLLPGNFLASGSYEHSMHRKLAKEETFGCIQLILYQNFDIVSNMISKSHNRPKSN